MIRSWGRGGSVSICPFFRVWLAQKRKQQIRVEQGYGIDVLDDFSEESGAKEAENQEVKESREEKMDV